MRKFIRFSLIAVAFAVICFTAYRYSRKGIDLEPQKSVEAILAEREKQLSNEINTPLGAAILVKNFNAASLALKDDKKPHLYLANVIRALFAQNKIESFTTNELDSLEFLALKQLEQEPGHDVLGFELLSTQLYRLPLLESTFSSYKLLETIIEKTTDDAHHEAARGVALAKLMIQGAPPAEKHIQQFESLFQKIPFGRWVTIVDNIRHEPTQTRVLQFIIRHYKKLKPEEQVQTLTIASSALTIPKNRELVLAALAAVRSTQNQALSESALRYLDALNQKQELKPQQKEDLLKSLQKVDSSEKSPFFASKIQELVKKLTVQKVSN